MTAVAAPSGRAGFLADAEPDDEVERMYTADLEAGLRRTPHPGLGPLAGGAARALLPAQASTQDAGIDQRQRAVLVAASAATLGDSYCSLAWGCGSPPWRATRPRRPPSPAPTRPCRMPSVPSPVGPPRRARPERRDRAGVDELRRPATTTGRSSRSRCSSRSGSPSRRSTTRSAPHPTRSSPGARRTPCGRRSPSAGNPRRARSTGHRGRRRTPATAIGCGHVVDDPGAVPGSGRRRGRVPSRRRALAGRPRPPRHRAAPYAACVGPLLVLRGGRRPGGRARERGRRPGCRERHRPRRRPRRAAGGEPPCSPPGWTRCTTRTGCGWRHRAAPGTRLARARLDDLSVALAVPRGDDHDTALADIRTAMHEGVRVVAKLGTGPSPTWPWPDEDEVADFLVATGALGGPSGSPAGCAVRSAAPAPSTACPRTTTATRHPPGASVAESGARREEIPGSSRLRDDDAPRRLVSACPHSTVARVREAFTAYGCCTVTDPLGEVATLGLLDIP